MRMEFKVTYADGRVVNAIAKPRDIVAFERQYNKSMQAFADEANPPLMEWLYYLAWAPLHRTRQDPRAFDEFLDDVDEVEGVEEAKPVVDPTQTAASAEVLPDSPSEPA